MALTHLLAVVALLLTSQAEYVFRYYSAATIVHTQKIGAALCPAPFTVQLYVFLMRYQYHTYVNTNIMLSLT